MPRNIILHSDLNCFYASVEINENPRLRDKAIAVCGSTENRHGIVRLKASELAAKGVQITVKDNELVSRQYQMTLTYPTRSPLNLAQAGFALFRQRYQWFKPVRAITIRVINLVSERQPLQLDLFCDHLHRERLQSLDDAIDEIRCRYGPRSIISASLMGNRKLAQDKCDLVMMPGMMYS